MEGHDGADGRREILLDLRPAAVQRISPAGPLDHVPLPDVEDVVSGYVSVSADGGCSIYMMALEAK